jgi:predicted dehydrogenase
MIDGRKIGWGIVGTGNIARQFCSGVKECKRGWLAGVGSRSIDSAREFAGRFGVGKFYGSYDEVIEDPAVEAVYISLPNSMHREWTIAALAAGKHVLCEKPIAANEAEAREMFAAAKRAGNILVEAFMYRAHPQTREVMEKVRGGAIGEVKLIRTSFCYRTNKMAGNIRWEAGLAGGALMDVGCYCINFSQMVAGGEAVSNHAHGKRHEGGVDEMVAGSMQFGSGVLASFTCGMRVQADNTAYICGTEGYVEIPWPWKPQKVGAKYWVKGSAPPRQDGGKVAPPPVAEFVVDAGMDLYGIEADAFAEVVLEGKAPFVSEGETIGTMRVLDEMRRQVGVR